MSNSLQPHGLQRARLLCPPLSPGVCSNSCPLCQWWYLTISTKKLMLLNCDTGEDSKSPLDCKDIKPVNPKENQSRMFIGRTAAEAEAPILCPLDAKTWLIGKDLDTGKDWRQREKGQQGVIIHGLTQLFYMN